MDNNYENQEEEYTSFKIAGFKCNANCPSDELLKIASFEDTMLKYDEENGVHYNACTIIDEKPKIVPIYTQSICDLSLGDIDKSDDDLVYRTYVEKKNNFLKNVLIKNTYLKGFEGPSGVQQLAIPRAIQRVDQLIQFKSGQGKTHAFVYSLLWGFDPEDHMLQYIIIANTHDLAKQIYDHVCSMLIIHDNETKMKVGMAGKVALCVGRKRNTAADDFRGNRVVLDKNEDTVPEKSVAQEMKEIREAQILVCTTGKLYELMIRRRQKQKLIDASALKGICIDEFDNIIAGNDNRNRGTDSMTTQQQISEIISSIPETAQRMFFSATVTRESLDLCYQYFRTPHENIHDGYDLSVKKPFSVLLDIDDSTLEQIKQYYVTCWEQDDKKEILKGIVDNYRVGQMFIFTNKIETGYEIQHYLANLETPFQARVMNGEMLEKEREKNLDEFKKNRFKILISTDVTARGIDVQSVSVVINYDIPKNLETYIHRAGRSGRYGRKGTVISFVIVPQHGNHYQRRYDSDRDNFRGRPRQENEMKFVEVINECSKNNKMVELPKNFSELI